MACPRARAIHRLQATLLDEEELESAVLKAELDDEEELESTELDAEEVVVVITNDDEELDPSLEEEVDVAVAEPETVGVDVASGTSFRKI